MLSTPEFWVAAGFVIFIIVAARPTMKAMGTMLDDRAEGIRKQIEEAQTLREEAQAALANYQRLQRDALKEAEEILEHAKSEATRIREQAEADLAASLARREQVAVEKIAQAEAKALQEVREQAVELAVGATRRLIDEKMTDDVRARLNADAIAELPTRLQ